MAQEKVSLILDLVDKTSKDVANIEKRMASFEKQVTKTDKSVSLLDNKLVKMAASYITLSAAIGQTKAIVTAGVEFERMQNALKFASGGAEEAKENFKFLQDESERLGLRIKENTQDFSKLLASTKPLGITLQETKTIFSGVAEAGSALGLSSEQVSGSLLAISQIASKGKVSMEEISGQLGERIPGSLSIAAKSMQMTEKDFIKLVSSGELMSKDFLPKFAKEMRKTFGQAAVDNADSAQAAFNRLNTSIFELRNAVAESGFLDFVTDMTKEITGLVKATKPFFDELKNKKNLFDTSGLSSKEDIDKKIKKLDEFMKVQVALNTEKATSYQIDIENGGMRSLFIEDNIKKSQEHVDKIREQINLLKVLKSNIKGTIGDPSALTAKTSSKLKIEIIDEEKEIGSLNKVLNFIAKKLGTEVTNNISYSLSAAENDFRDSIAYSVGQGVSDGLLEGDFSAFEDALKSASSSAIASAISTSMSGLSTGALVGVGVAGLIGSKLFGSKEETPKVDFAEEGQKAFDDLIDSIRDNTKAIETYSPNLAKVQEEKALVESSTKLQEKYNYLSESIEKVTDWNTLQSLSTEELTKIVDFYYKEVEDTTLGVEGLKFAVANARDGLFEYDDEIIYSKNKLEEWNSTLKESADAIKKYNEEFISRTAQGGELTFQEAVNLIAIKKNELEGGSLGDLGRAVEEFEKYSEKDKLEFSKLVLSELQTASNLALKERAGYGDANFNEKTKEFLTLFQDVPEIEIALQSFIDATNEATEAQKENTTSLINGIRDITSSQMQFLNSTIPLTEDNVTYLSKLQEQFNAEDQRIDTLRASIEAKGSDATAQELTELSRSEQGLLGLGGTIKDLALETFGSGKAGTAYIENVTDKIRDNLNENLDIETQLMNKNNDLLGEIRDDIRAQNDLYRRAIVIA